MSPLATALLALLLLAGEAPTSSPSRRASTAARKRKAQTPPAARIQAPSAQRPAQAPLQVPAPRPRGDPDLHVPLPPPPPPTTPRPASPPEPGAPATDGPALDLGEPAESAPGSAPPSRWLAGVHVRAGGLLLTPTGRGDEVEMANVTPMARLSGMKDGPISGSSTGLGGAFMPAAILGYAPPILDRQLSFETILALPFKQKMTARGRLADTSLSPSALGLSTGVPPLGTELGEVKLLPPVVTAVYRFLPRARVRPYLGAGGCALVVLDARITNPVLTSVRQPRVEIPPVLAWVAQAGVDVRVGLDALGGRAVVLTADAKYVGGMNVTARVKDIWVTLPDLPLYGATKVGDTVARMRIDPVIAFVGVGLEL